MVFSSLTFLVVFLPSTLIIYYLAKEQYRNFVLLIGSLFFYSWGEPKYVLLMMASIIVNYIAGILIERFGDWQRKALLSLAIAFNLGVLLYFKYANFFISSMNRVGIQIEALNILLPLGISFFTFQALSYVIDVYRSNARCQRKLINLALYISFFPQLIAGPIVRYNTIEEQINNRTESIDKFAEGLRRIIIGLGKKVILANQIGLVATEIIDKGTIANLPLVASWVGILCFMLQLYFDFSGYSDMAIGLAKLFGFDFLENFNYPYIAKTVTDFWTRWHISLSSWFKDYLYIPLGGSRVKVPRHIFNLLFVWTITGFWHGADYNFILWGFYYALALIAEKYILRKILKKLPSAVTWFYTMMVFLISLVIFRVDGLGRVKTYFSVMIGATFNGFTNTGFLSLLQNSAVIIIVGLIASTPLLKNIYNKHSDKLFIRITRDVLLFALLVISLSMLASGGFNPFIYFRF